MAVPLVLGAGGAVARGAVALGRLLPGSGSIASRATGAVNAARNAAGNVGSRVAGVAGRVLPAAGLAAGAASLLGGGGSEGEQEPTRENSPAQRQEEERTERRERVIGTDATNQLLDRLLDDERFRPNPLNDDWQVAYHWRLFATNDRDLIVQAGNPHDIGALLTALDNLPQVVIAESGVTAGYNIKSVTFNSTVAPNYRTRNFNATEFTMEIVEPLGTSFTDAVALASIELGVANFEKAFYLLELTFRGYDPDGNAEANPVQSENYQNGGRWVWMVKINEIDTNFTSSGGSYTIKAIPYEQQLFSDEQLLRLTEMRQVSGATVGEFMTSLTRALNDGWLNRYGPDRSAGNRGIIHFEEVIIEPVEHRSLPAGQNDPRGWRLVPADADRQTERTRPMGIRRGENGVPEGRFPMGTPFTEIIEQMFASTEYARDLGLDRGGNRQGEANASANRVNEQGFRESVVFRVEPALEVRSFDEVSRQYALNIKLFIRAHYTQIPVLTPEEVDQAESPEVQKRMLAALNARNFMRKRYEYLFTGRNTEVRALDIRYNLKWAFPIPAMEGAQSRITGHDVGPRTSEYTRSSEADRPIVNPELRTRELQNLNTRARELTSQQVSLSSDIQRLQGQIERAERAQTEARSDEQRNAAQADAIRFRDEQDRAVFNRNSNSNELGDVRARIQELAPQREIAERIRGQGRVFAEDEVREVPSRRPRPQISFEQVTAEQINRSVGVGFYAPTHRDKSLFGAILEQLYTPFSGFFVSIDLDIRGDPYWLGQGNLERQTTMRRGVSAQSPQQQGNNNTPPPLPDWFRGDNTLLLVFRYPFTIGEDGAPMLRPQDIFNGVYQVAEITNTFSEGEFSQKLSCRRLPLLDIAKAFAVETNEPVRRDEANQQAPVAPSPASQAPAPQAPQTPQQGAEAPAAPRGNAVVVDGVRYSAGAEAALARREALLSASPEELAAESARRAASIGQRLYNPARPGAGSAMPEWDQGLRPPSGSINPNIGRQQS